MAKYRLIHGKHHEAIPGSAAVRTYKPGDIIELTGEQARLLSDPRRYPDGKIRVQGPVADDAQSQALETTSASSTITAASPEGQALEAVKGNYEQMRDIVRIADKDYLSALQIAEASRQGGPRPSVLQMIEKRQKGLAEPAA